MDWEAAGLPRAQGPGGRDSRKPLASALSMVLNAPCGGFFVSGFLARVARPGSPSAGGDELCVSHGAGELLNASQGMCK